MCITTLSSNIEQIKAEGLDAKSAEISICVYTDDLEKGLENPIFYATRYGMLYNPNDEFKPNAIGGQRIKGAHVDSYFDQLPKAREEYKRRLDAYQRGNGGNNDNSTEIKEMKETIKRQTIRISEQASRIAELSAQGAKNENKSQVEQLNKMIETLQEIQGNRIEIIQKGKAPKILEKIVHEKFSTILQFISRGQAVYLHGEAGTGKSRIAEDIAEALDLDFYPASTITQEFKLSGFRDGNGRFHETNFYKALKYGGLFFLDEMDSCVSEALVGLNGTLASGYYDFDGETVHAHENFRVIGAGNTIGRGADEKYTGRQALDMSTLDRFWAIPIDYSPAIDNAVAKGDKDLVQFAQEIRRASLETGIIIIMSYRSLGRIADYQDLLPLKEVMQYAVIKGIDADDVRMLSRNLNLPMTNKYYKAFREAC